MSVHFVLTALESSVTMDLSASVQVSEIPILDTSATAVLQVSVADMKSVFQFQTDSNDLTDLDATDIKYYVKMDSWPVLNPANAMLDDGDSKDAIATSNADGPLASNKMLVAHDFVRFLALRLFNTHLGVDLFNNEVDLLKDLRKICGNQLEGQTWFDVTAKLHKVSVNGDHPDIVGDTDGQKYMTNANNTADNLCRVLLEQMTKSAISRFHEAGTISGETEQGLPFKAGDSISFKLNISPADGQEELTGIDPIETRSYEIRLNIVESPNNTEVDEAETA